MRNTVRIFTLLLVCTSLSSALATTPKTVDLVFADFQALLDLKTKMQQNDPQAQSRLSSLIEQADRVLDEPAPSVMQKKRMPPSGDMHDYISLGPYWWPDPKKDDGLPWIRRDGRVNPETRGENTDYPAKERFISRVRTLALAAFYADDLKYAQKAVELLNTWFVDPASRMNPHLEFAQGIPGINTGRGIGIIDWNNIGEVATGIQLLHAMNAIDPTTYQTILDWFKDYLNWLQTSEKGIYESQRRNNHGTWYDVQVAGILLFLDKKAEARQLLESVKTNRIATQIEPDGRQPHELARTKSFSYSKMNLRAFMKLVDLGRKVGVDLWNYETPDGRSIQKAQDFLTPYLNNPEKWEYPQLSTTEMDSPGNITGELKKWHKITITFEGPSASETGDPNPFLDYRFNVTFINGGRCFVAPGYFAADGDAVNTSADSGSKWRVHFAPDAEGRWDYTVAFRTGAQVAVSADPDAGKPVSGLDGVTGSFTVQPTDKTGRDLRGKGLLRYVHQHHFQFAETGEYFLKQGADAPENLLAYADFDNTPNYGNRRKTWAPHVQDWNPGDPTWSKDKGKGLIGAVNYLASEGLNAFSFLTYNIGGDDKNVFPMISDAKVDRTRYDCSKLDQWEIVFEHGDKMGMYLHFKLQERENDGGHATEDMEVALDEGDLGVERKLYFRELIARFGHHLALNWNLGEENEQTTRQQQDMAQYLYDNDPYRHPIVLHTTPEKLEQIYTPLLGNRSRLNGVSVQGGDNEYLDIYPKVAAWVRKSADAGRKWVVANDEQGKGFYGILPDKDAGETHDKARKRVIWATIMAGGAGCEHYFGSRYDHGDLTCEDFRSRDRWWDYCRYALEFFEKTQAPFWTMSPQNNRITGKDNWVLADPGDAYLVYLPDGGSAELDLCDSRGQFSVLWYNPVTGGRLQEGSVPEVTGGAVVCIGTPPDTPGQDWVVWISKPAGQTTAGD
jgi:hypothetical protein